MSISGNLFLSNLEYEKDGNIEYYASIVDWRELIYQMALDYRRWYYSTDNFLTQVQENNGKLDNGEWRYPGGITGYEQYYVDMEGFWRQIYCPANVSFFQTTLTSSNYTDEEYAPYIFCRVWVDDLIFVQTSTYYGWASSGGFEEGYIQVYNPITEEVELVWISTGGYIYYSIDQVNKAVLYSSLPEAGDAYLGEVIKVGIDSENSTPTYYLGTGSGWEEIDANYSAYYDYFMRGGYEWKDEEDKTYQDMRKTVYDSPESLNF